MSSENVGISGLKENTRRRLRFYKVIADAKNYDCAINRLLDLAKVPKMIEEASS
ncbi:MAG: hypothetical protein ACFFD4_02370 [Candidatus Odinarchaeota archaeon]